MKNKLVLKYPSSWWGAKWREALPSGNGTIGAGVYGAVQEETVLLTHEDLWHLSQTPEMPDLSEHLAEVRRLLDDEKVREADALYRDLFNEKGYKPKIGSPLPLGDLKISMPVSKGFRNYRRVLDMETGEVSVTWKDGEYSYSRSLFVSRPDDVVVMEIASNDPGLNVELGLDLHDVADRYGMGHHSVELPGHVDITSDPKGYIRYAARNDDGTDFGAVARVLPLNGAEGKPVLSAKDGTISVSGTRRILIAVKLFVSASRQTAWADLTRRLNNTVMDYGALLAAHVVEHRELMDRVSIDLGGSEDDHLASNEELLLRAYEEEPPTSMVEKMWAFGRYLLVSSSRANGQPCPLHGIWCGSYTGMWTFHMANENLEMIYWQAASGNLAETMLPVFEYYERLMEDFRENARKLYGCRGIYIPAVSTPESGLLKVIAPHIIYWTGAAGWIGQMYFDYYLHTQDKDFLRDRVVPFLRETALFYEDFFTIDENGYYKSSPSNSPENTPGNYWDGQGMGADMETTMNATMDFALAKEVLTHLLEAAAVLGIDDDDVSKWRAMRDKIPAYHLTEDASVREWMHPHFEENNHHRHMSHLYPVFPGMEVTADSDPELFGAFEKSLHKRLDIGIGETTGWSLAHQANIYARFRDGNGALNCLNLLARSCLMNNFYTTHNDWRSMGIGVDMPWAPFQIDANMGWTAAIQEMLMVSLPGKIDLLPALPDKWKHGSFRGMVARGNVEVSASWDVASEHLSVELCAMTADQHVALTIPYGDRKSIDVELEQGKQVILNFESTSQELQVVSS